MITLETLEKELGAEYEPPIFFYEEEDKVSETGAARIHASVCCVSVEIDSLQLKSHFEHRWSVGPYLQEAEPGYYFAERVDHVGEVVLTPTERDHAELHGFDPLALLAFESLLFAYQSQYYGQYSDEYCSSSVEDDANWIRYFLRYLIPLRTESCECGENAKAKAQSLLDYAEELGLLL